MATTITNLFQIEYQKDVHHIFQREGAFLKVTTRLRSNVIGSTSRYNRVGKGVATAKARHGQITPMNNDRTTVSATLEDWYAGDWADDLDLAKTEVDEKMAIARSGAFALGRKCDELIIVALDGTSNSGTSWTLTSKETVENSALLFAEELFNNDVNNDGQNYAVVTMRCWNQLMKVESFSSADFVGPDGMSFKDGVAVGPRFKDWNGLKWQAHTGLTEAFTGTTAATRKIYAYSKIAVGFAMAKHAKNIAANPAVVASMQYYNTHEAWFINHLFSAGAVLIDDAGVIEQTFNDTTALVTS